MLSLTDCQEIDSTDQVDVTQYTDFTSGDDL